VRIAKLGDDYHPKPRILRRWPRQRFIAARTDLCGERITMCVPTAMATRKRRRSSDAIPKMRERQFVMSAPSLTPDQALVWLRRRLPVSARMRPSLLKHAKATSRSPMISPNCRITGLQEVGSGTVICYVEYFTRESMKRLLVAPLSQLSFGRGHPLSRLFATTRDN